MSLLDRRLARLRQAQSDHFDIIDDLDKHGSYALGSESAKRRRISKQLASTERFERILKRLHLA